MGEGLIRQLFSGPLDIVGDVHGEIDALRALLHRLGYDDHGHHPEGRRLVFVGDLCDRGPDSPAVVRLVERLVDEGRAQCVLGNHELNILRGERKHGNHWFFPDADPKHEKELGPTVFATPEERVSFPAFFARMPIALENEDLRVVHAAWIDAMIAVGRKQKGSALAAYAAFDKVAVNSEVASALKRAHDDEKTRHGAALSDLEREPPFLEAIAAYDEYQQMSNPLKVITSGVERLTQSPFPAGGKWRFVERVPWWKSYRGRVPVVFGHYWRWWDPADQQELSKGEANLFKDGAPDAWQRNDDGVEVAICIDYSVGARFKQRKQQNVGGFAGRLAALQWPERVLKFDTDR